MTDGTEKKYGLTDEQVRISYEKYGNNSLKEVEQEGFWDKFMGNLGDPMIKILVVALIINVVFVFLGQTEWFEALAIAVAVLIATFVSTYSEHKNENAFQKLQEDASKITCKVYRNGQIVYVKIDDLVVGDAVLLQAGDKVPADGRLLNGNLRVDQATLNGEAEEAKKQAMPTDFTPPEDDVTDFLDIHKMFRGSVVCSGNAVMEVTVVGDKSVYGQLAAELQQDDDRDSPLKVKLSKLADDISKFGYIGGILIAVAFLFQRIVLSHIGVEGYDFGYLIGQYFSFDNWMYIVDDVVRAVMFAVIIIVMAVPEGLPLMIAIVSSLNMRKMLKSNVLVRELAGIETAGSLNILFSDKTGTITKGELEAVTFVTGDGTELKALDSAGAGIGKIISASIFNNTSAHINETGGKLKAIGGNGTERAILDYALNAANGKDSAAAAAKTTVVRAIPFNSANKYSAAQIKGDISLSLIKGAPEKLLDRCKTYYDAEGNIQPFTPSAINEKINELANRAIRVLAFAASNADLGEEDLPAGDFTFIGIVGIRDEIRPESIAAIEEVHAAGVQVVMITGDRMETAVAIAKEAGLLVKETDIAMTSDELAKLSDEELKQKLPYIKVIARSLPSDKSRLVRAAQALNLVAGMTGDGVNDSPALKASDVGFAMGSGTEVAKEAGEIIILDDNFNSIDSAILYGRTIFNTIRKFITFQLTINVACVAITFVMPFFDRDPPLTIIQILWLNLVMDTLGALAFGAEPALKRYMHEKPKSRDENIISRYMKSSIGIGGITVVALSLFFLLSPWVSDFFRVYEVTADSIAGSNRYLMTGFFAFFVFIYVFNAFNIRTEKMNLFENFGANKGFIAILALIVIVQLGMTYIGRDVLSTYGLTLRELGFVIALAFIIVPVDLLRKLIIGRTQ